MRTDCFLLWIYSIIPNRNEEFKFSILFLFLLIAQCSHQWHRVVGDSQQVLFPTSIQVLRFRSIRSGRKRRWRTEDGIPRGPGRAPALASNCSIIDRIASCKHFYLPLKIKRSRWPFFLSLFILLNTSLTILLFRRLNICVWFCSAAAAKGSRLGSAFDTKINCSKSVVWLSFHSFVVTKEFIFLNYENRFAVSGVESFFFHFHWTRYIFVLFFLSFTNAH